MSSFAARAEQIQDIEYILSQILLVSFPDLKGITRDDWSLSQCLADFFPLSF